MIKKDKLEKSFIDCNASILDALKAINSSGIQIALILNENKILEGVITDGDIRRSLLKGYKLTDKINKEINFRKSMAMNASKILNFEIIDFLDLPNLRMENLEILDIVKKITKVVKKVKKGRSPESLELGMGSLQLQLLEPIHHSLHRKARHELCREHC